MMTLAVSSENTLLDSLNIFKGSFTGFRNAELVKKGFFAPKAVKTGTTIAGIVFKDGVILGADTRATFDNIICDKNSEKIHYMAKNI